MSFKKVLGLLVLVATPTPSFAAGAALASASTLFSLYFGGMIFLLFEFFLFPGFGIPGLIGCLLMGSNAILLVQTYGYGLAGTILAAETLVGIGVAGVAMKVLPHTAVGRLMTHKVSLLETKPRQAGLDPDLWIDKTGVTASALRPKGSVRFDQQEIPARSQSSLIQAGQSVRVVAVEGSILVVVPQENN